MEVLGLPVEIQKRDAGNNMVQMNQQQQTANGTMIGNNRKTRPASALHRGAPVIHSQAS